MYDALRGHEDTFSTDIWPVAMYYSIWVYHHIPDMQYVWCAIEIWSRSRFDPVSYTVINCLVWVFPAYVLEPNFQKPGVNTPNWDIRIRRGINTWFIKIHSTQVGLVLKLLTASISPQYHVVFDVMFSTVSHLRK